MPAETTPLPHFAAAPVVEVALSVSFRPIAKLRMIELIRAWQELFSEAFPNPEEQAPYQMPVERFRGEPQTSTFSLQLMQGLPVPRLQLRDDTGSGLLQLQNNWFARNWRKAGPQSDYPRYFSLRQPFEDDVARLRDYLTHKGFGEFVPVQCELTYVNHIANGATIDVGEVLTLVTPRALLARDLESPETTQVRSQFVIRHQGAPVGRVHVSADPATRRSDNAPIIVINVTARGMPLGKGVGGVLSFLDVAHDRAVRIFDAVTRPAMHALWRRMDDA